MTKRASRRLLRTEAAELAGVSPDTWSGYVTRGQAPGPVERIGSTPRWDEAEVRAWLANRPGRGSRRTARAQQRARQRQDREES